MSRLTLGFTTLAVGVIWLCIGIVFTFVNGFPEIMVWYSGLSYIDQMAYTFGVPGAVLILISTFIIIVSTPPFVHQQEAGDNE